MLVCKAGESLQTARKLSAQLALLAQDEGFEIMEYTIQAGKRLSIDPGPRNSLEFFYILEGSLHLLIGKEEKEIGTGDYIVARNITETAHFKTKDRVKLLYFSSQPIFGTLSTEIRQLTKIVRQVAKKDAYTFGHGGRLEKHVIGVGEKLNLSPREIECLIEGAVFHDIGKINIPDAILQKPGKLTEEEWEVIKKHPIIGRDMLKNTQLADIADIVLQHHERVNGKGYPLGLTGDKIRIEAKIVAVLDAFDAMTSRRPYRPALSQAEALAELRAKSDTQFDPKVVEALEQVLAEESAISRKKRSGVKKEGNNKS